MKDKKDLRNNTKSTKYLLIVAKVVGVLTALVFFVTLTYGTVNASISREISNQYQDKVDCKINPNAVRTKKISFL